MSVVEKAVVMLGCLGLVLAASYPKGFQPPKSLQLLGRQMLPNHALLLSRLLLFFHPTAHLPAHLPA